MKRTLKNIAALMLLVAGTITFTSCNDEEEMSQRNRLNKLDRVEDLSIFEQNGYTAEEIFKKTAEFSTQLRDNHVVDMSINDAVVVLETFWNYGIVARMGEASEDYISMKKFSLNLPIENDTISGETLYTRFKLFLTEVLTVVPRRELNLGDISVVSYDSTDIILQLTILPKFSQPDVMVDALGPRISVVKDSGATCTLPNTFNINPYSYPNTADNAAKEIKGLAPYFKTSIMGVIANIQDDTLLGTPLKSWIYDADRTDGYKILNTSMVPSVYTWVYTTPVDVHDLTDRIMPKYLAAVDHYLDNGKRLQTMIPYGHRISTDTLRNLVSQFEHSFLESESASVVGGNAINSIEQFEFFSYRIGICSYGEISHDYSAWFATYFSQIVLPNGYIAL